MLINLLLWWFRLLTYDVQIHIIHQYFIIWKVNIIYIPLEMNRYIHVWYHNNMIPVDTHMMISLLRYIQNSHCMSYWTWSKLQPFQYYDFPLWGCLLAQNCFNKSESTQLKMPLTLTTGVLSHYPRWKLYQNLMYISVRVHFVLPKLDKHV